MARIEISSVSNPYGTGELQLQGKVAMSGTLTAVTDNLNTASPLKLSTGGVQVASTLQITTNSNPYIDAEDGSGNNRFTVGRDPSSQVVNVDFASNPTGGTNQVGAIRTYTDGVSLSNVMSFRKDGNVGFGTNNPIEKLSVQGTASVTKIGDNNHSSILSVLNTDSTNTTFGFLFKTYSDGGYNRYIELEGSNTTGNNLNGSWVNTGGFAVLNGITNQFHSNFPIYQQYSNNVDTAILFNNSNNLYQTRIWRDGNVSIADSSYNTSASVTSRLFVKGTGSTSGTTSLLVQNSAGTELFKVRDDGYVNVSATNGMNIGGLYLSGLSYNGIINFGNNDLSIGCDVNSRRVNLYSGNTNVLTIFKSATNYGVGISDSGSDYPVPSAVLQADSTTRGFLPPRMTDAQVRAIVSPAVGLMAYNTTLDCPVFYSSAGWRKVSHSAM